MQRGQGQKVEREDVCGDLGAGALLGWGYMLHLQGKGLTGEEVGELRVGGNLLVTRRSKMRAG